MEERRFGVSLELMKLFTLASASASHPNAADKPTLEQIDGTWFLVFRVREGSGHQAQEVSRCVPLDDFSEEDLNTLKQCYSSVDLRRVIDVGLRKGLSELDNPKVRKAFLALLTRINPRHLAELLFLYRLAHEQGNGPTVEFETNDLLDALYERSNNGGKHASNVRGLVRRDIHNLAFNPIKYKDFGHTAESSRVRTRYKTFLTLEASDVDKRRMIYRDDDYDWASEETDRTPDAFIVTLNFFEKKRILLPVSMNLKQSDSLQTNRNYEVQLFQYILSKIENIIEGEYFAITLNELYTHFDLTDKNTVRKREVVWRAIEKLKGSQFLLDARATFSGKRQSQTGVELLVNHTKISIERTTEQEESGQQILFLDS
jgi:hypothetical protein